MDIAYIPVIEKEVTILKRKILGKAVLYWVMKAACECSKIDRTFVIVNDDTIRTQIVRMINDNCYLFQKVEIVNKFTQQAEKTYEESLVEFAHGYEFENVIFLKPLSPLLTVSDIDRAFYVFDENVMDGVLSGMHLKASTKMIDQNGNIICEDEQNKKSLLDVTNTNLFVTDGLLYITSRKKLLNSGLCSNRKIKILEMDYEFPLSIENINQELLEFLLKQRMKNTNRGIQQVKLFLTDCDGCLTDAGMYYTENGDEIKKFNARDGLGFSLLRQAGIMTGIITGEDVQLNTRRVKKLKLDIYEPGCSNKAAKIRQICEKYNIPLEEVVYIGDDVNDLEALKIVGYSCCPADAVWAVKEQVDYIASANGGHGVIREVVDIIITNNGERYNG